MGYRWSGQDPAKTGKKSGSGINKVIAVTGNEVYFRVAVTKGALCQFSYSTDGVHFILAGEPFQAEPGQWIGAKTGLFATRITQTNDSGYADYDWFRIN